MNSTGDVKVTRLETPLGAMIAIADDRALYLLEFSNRRGLEREVERFKKQTKLIAIPGRNSIINLVEKELQQYFSGKLTKFKTPLSLIGTDFQKSVWKALIKIPHGETCSYADIAKAIGRPTAYRAVARANGSNKHPIIIPCHRVIASNGDLCGYSSGVKRKEWLLKHEGR